MSNSHQGFIHKSYQLLFILYAPVALISILVTVISDSYISYVYLTALITGGFSIVIGIVMCIQFWRYREVISRDKEAHIPYIVRHRFMIMYIPIAIISLVISSYSIFDKYVNKIELYNKQQHTQISILFPIYNELGVKFDDAEQAHLGLGTFFVNFPEYSNDYHITLFDHKNKYNSALEKEVLTKIDKGTRYFICAYSNVCRNLANNFDSLLAQSDFDERPILITTLSSSMNLPLEKGTFYRFFVRNREDARILALNAYGKGIRKASFIATKDAYGEDAAQHFIEAWKDLGGELMEGVYVDPNLSDEVVANKIRNSKLMTMERAAVFVAHYQNINKSLQLLSKDTLYLLSANYQQNVIAQLAQNIPHKQLIFALPSYKATHAKLKNTAAAFIYMTLDKLINADQQLLDGATEFHSAWHQTDYPAILEFRTDGVADFRIEMEAFSYGNDIHLEKE